MNRSETPSQFLGLKGQQSIVSFFAMEYYGLVLNRSYLVTVTKNAICGAKVLGLVGAPVTKMGIDEWRDPRNFINRKTLEKYHSINPESLAFLAIDKANFQILYDKIKKVSFSPKKKISMGAILHSGSISFHLTDGRKKELILLGDQDGHEIERLILSAYLSASHTQAGGQQRNQTKPELKQFGELTQADFERFPVWVSVHILDYDAPWYEETNEETFRPWLGNLPVDPGITIFLVRSQMVLADGTLFSGFITPVTGNGNVTDSDLGNVQPHLLHSQGLLIPFWGGIIGFTGDTKKSFYDALNRTSDQVFPIHFSTEPGLTYGRQSGEVRGFYKYLDFRTGEFEITT